MKRISFLWSQRVVSILPF